MNKINGSTSNLVFRCQNYRLNLSQKIHVMGIVNITPDSFSDGGNFFEKDQAIAHAKKLIEDGADIIDIGGESSRPGAKSITIDEELKRVIPVVEILAKETNTPISIDTYKSIVAEEAMKAGAHIINDISGGQFDPGIAKIAAKYQAGMVLMHIRGTPQNMQKEIHYDDLFDDIIDYLKKGIYIAENAGVASDQIIIDPGIGFGKTVKHNLLLIKYLNRFNELQKPILIGASRKSFIGKIDGSDVYNRLGGSLAAAMAAVQHGAHVVRVHDVRETKQAIQIINAILGADLSEDDAS